MGFTSYCAIHDSNPRIWRRLMNLGLHPDSCDTKMIARSNVNRICTVVERGTFMCVKEDDLSKKSVDCGTNEDIFFALATLRDDTDIHQWFIYDNRDWDDEDPQRFWFLCKQESVEDDMCYDQMYQDCEKATEREIIEHFSCLDDDIDIINQ